MTNTSEQSPSLRRHFIRGSIGSLAFQISGTALSLVMAVILARVLGVEGFGVYTFCFSIAQILTVPAWLGAPQLLVREVAAYRTRGDHHLLRGLLHRLSQASFLASLIITLAAAGIGFIFYRDSPVLAPFLVALILIPLQAGTGIKGATLRGLRHVLLGQAPQTFRPVLVIIIVGFLFLFTAEPLTPKTVLAAVAASSGILLVILHTFLHRALPQEVRGTSPEFETSIWMRSMLPFILASGMQILNKEISIVLLGVMQEAESAGLYRVAQRGAMIVPFGLLAVNMVIAPSISEFFTRGEKQRLQNLINKSVLAVSAFALPVSLGLIVFGRWLLPLVFGQDFAPAYLPMVILCLGQLFNVVMGSIGVILNMTGLERFTAKGVAIGTLINVVMCLILIPYFGATGAAIATSISMVVVNIVLAIWLYRETGIISTIRISVFQRKEA